MLDGSTDEAVITHTLVPAAVSNSTRADRVNIEFTFDGETGCVAPISAPLQLPTLDDVRMLLDHCPDFAPISKYLAHD